jgi:hypothetical protein
MRWVFVAPLLAILLTVNLASTHTAATSKHAEEPGQRVTGLFERLEGR